MKYLLYTIFSLLFVAQLSAKEKKVFSYPDSLNHDADAVIISDEKILDRSSLTKLTEHRKLIMVIRNQKGQHHAQMYVNYNSYSKVENFSCITYSLVGTKIKDYKNKEINDFSYYSDYTLYSDNRVQGINVQNAYYPYVIEFSYTKTYNGFFRLPTWTPQNYPNLAIYRSSLTVTTTTDLPFINKPHHLSSLSHTQTIENNQIIDRWELLGAKAKEAEEDSPHFREIGPSVSIAPTTFQFNGYFGCNSSWKDVGLFYTSLFDTKMELTQETIAALERIKEEAQSSEELVSMVYRYMQNRTRYVGIQLGIGGWQPFPSLTVDETGYGDCKALSFYTKTLLKYIGIESNYVVLGSGDTKIKHHDFTSNQTNHAILCVPNDTDTLWLECTSQTAPFNHLSSSCTNRYVLIVDGEQSRLQYLPQKNQNLYTRNSTITFHHNDKTHCDEEIHMSGTFFDKYSQLPLLSNKELLKHQQLTIKGSDIQMHNCRATLCNDSAIVVLKRSYNKAGTITQAGDLLIYKPTLSPRLETQKIQKKKRQMPLQFDDQNIVIDSINIEIPKGYELEYIPNNQTLSSKYGSFSYQFEQTKAQISITSRYVQTKGQFPAEDYIAYIEFMNKVSASAHRQLIFKKTIH